MEKAVLEEFNPWWINGKVDSDLALPHFRPVYNEVWGAIEKRFVLALVGLRRTGKTTIMYQLIKELLQKGVSPKEIFFFSFDEKNASLNEIIEKYKEIHPTDFREKKIYFFLDEIQKCPDWENETKKYYDLYPKIKFIISGSESLFIRKKTKETLAGRIFEYALTPLNFQEYLKINNVKENEFAYETKIKPFFLKYIQRGGFPETIKIENDREFKNYVRSLVTDKIIYKDIPKIFKIDDPEFLATLLEIISTNPGMYLDYQSLSKQLGKDRRVIKNYLMYLKESFLIRIIGNYRKGSLTTIRKIKRAYPTDNAIIFLYKTNIDDPFFAKMVETAIINQSNATTFWKNHGEIDLIQETKPIEIKYQQNIRPEDYKTLKEFMKKFNKKEALLLTKKDEGKIKTKEGTITLTPTWKWLLKK